MADFKKTILSGVGSILLCISLIGGTVCFLLDKEEVSNSFSCGIAELEITEPAWDSLSPVEKVVYPGKVVEKDPSVKNTGDVDMFVFAEVHIPVSSVKIVGDDGVSVSYHEEKELFSFDANAGWKFIRKYMTEEGDAVYLYGYGEKLEAGACSTPVFNNIRTVNYLEGSIGNDEGVNVPVRAFGIQSDHLIYEKGEVCDVENIESVYKTFFDQKNTEGGG